MNFLKLNCCDGIYASSIDIRFTKACDNDCSFCIEKGGAESFGKTNVMRMVQSVRNGVLYEGKDTVLILGGEPFLFVDELNEFVNRIRPDVDQIYITTSLPKELKINDPKVYEIMEKIDGLNVSLHHWDWEKNNEILNASRKHNRVQQLDKLGLLFGYKIRLQCNLVKGGIETQEDVQKVLRIAEQYDIVEVKFNELQDVGEDLYVSWDNIFPEHNLKHPYSNGCVTEIADHLADCKVPFVTVKRCCFMVQPFSPHGASIKDVLKVIMKKFQRKQPTGASVIYENGLRSKGWLTQATLIHKEKI